MAIRVKKQFSRVLKGSGKDPFLYLAIISAIFFGILSFLPQRFINKTNDSLFLAAFSFNFSKYNEEPFVNPRNSWPESPELSLIENNCLMAFSPPVTVTPQVLGEILGETGTDRGKEIVEYLVEPGDSLWLIAEKFNISLDTLIWANKLKGQLQPGQTLLVLPVTGVMHLVKEGDTVQALAKKYKTDKEKITAFNDRSNEEDIFVNEVLIIPDGRLPAPPSEIREPKISQRLSTGNFYGQSAIYPYGQCTWWVAQKRAIPSWGHAKDWLNNATAAGYAVCKGSYCIPKAGAVISLRGNKYFGHVGYVEEVKGDKVIFSEMNYIGLARMNHRSLRMGDPAIKGYIY